MDFFEKYKSITLPFGHISYVQLVGNMLMQVSSEKDFQALSAAVPVTARVRAVGAARTPRTAAKTPEKSVYVRPNGQEYHARKWGEWQDVEVLQMARQSRLFPLLYGAPGCGKTALVEAAFGADVITLQGTGDTETGDLEGGYVQTADGGFVWVDGGYLRALEGGKVYFIDEIGLIDPKMLSMVYSVMDGRDEYVVTMNPERGTVKAHPDFFVVAATNPNAPGVRLSEALLSRFTLQAEMSTDFSLAESKLGVPALMVGCAKNMQIKVTENKMNWAPQMRELLAFRDISAKFGQDFAIRNLIATAPEMDRPTVAKVLAAAYGKDLKAARI